MINSGGWRTIVPIFLTIALIITCGVRGCLALGKEISVIGWLIAGFVVVFLLGWVVNTISKQTWPTWTAAGRMQLWKAALTLFFLSAWTLASIVSIYYVWGVQAPSAAKPKDPPSCAAGAALEVKDLDPEEITTGSPSRSLRIRGCGFANKATVTINGTNHEANFVDANQIVAVLKDIDKSRPDTLVVSVTNPAVAAVPGPPPVAAAPAATSTKTMRVVPCCSLPWAGPCAPITAELRLLLLVLLAGTLGSSVYALKSLADYLGNKSLMESWFAYYLIQPLEGAGVAFIYYVVVRGGFFAGSADAKSVNEYFVSAVGALVGLFSDQAIKKLSELFTTLFHPKDDRGDKMDGPQITTESLPAVAQGATYDASLTAEGGKTPYKWTVDSLPASLSLSDDGKISGTPTAAPPPTPRTFTVTDAAGKKATVKLNL